MSEKTKTSKMGRDISKSHKAYNKAFKTEIWSKLSSETRQMLCRRFDLTINGDTLKQIIKAFGTPIIPKAFCIAAVSQLKNPSRAAFDLVDKNIFNEEYKSIITYDEFQWGSRRLDNEPYLGILEHNENKVSETKKKYFEYLLRCSLSLNFDEKMRIVREASTLTPFQINSLITVFEEELDSWYNISSKEQKSDIPKMIKNQETIWTQIKEKVSLYAQNRLDKSNAPTPKAIAIQLQASVKGQEEAVKQIATSIYYQSKIADYIKKKKNFPFSWRIEPLLLTGPTGCGKSFLIKKAAQLADLSFVHIDAASLVSVGIKGYNVNDALKDLIRKSDFDLAKAECGMIYFDEMDKLLIHHDGQSILSQLLRVVEGGEFLIEKNNSTEEKEFQNISHINTTHILFLFGGSFEMQSQLSSGFIKTEKSFKKRTELYKSGLTRELLGRVEDIIALKKLEKEDMRDILLKSKESPLIKYQQMLSLNDIQVDIPESVIDDIIEQAYHSPYGARTLNTLLKEYFFRQLFEI